MKLEVIADSVESSIAAVQGGADRIELCSGLLEGGITPSYGLIEQVRKVVSIELYVMIRPRGGDFLYSGEELDVMKKDIQMAKNLKADGVVLGVLDEEGNIPGKLIADLVKKARPLKVTFHRAFDYAKNPVESLEVLCAVQVDRILTSGQRNSAFEGRELIKELVDRAGQRIIIMPGGGILESHIGMLMKETGASECHISAKSIVESKMNYKSPTLSIGRDPQRDEYRRYSTDQSIVQKIRYILDQLPLVGKGV